MPPPSKKRLSGLLAGIVLVGAGLFPVGGEAAEPLRLTTTQLDTVVAGNSSGGADVSGNVVVSSGDNRIRGRLNVRSRSNLESSSASGFIYVSGSAKGPGAQAVAQTDGAAQGALTTKQTITARIRVPNYFAYGVSATMVTGVTPSRGF